MRCEIIREPQAAGSGKLDETVAAVAVHGETGGIERGVKRSIADYEEQIPSRVCCGRGAGHPDAAVASVRHEIQDTGLR